MLKKLDKSEAYELRAAEEGTKPSLVSRLFRFVIQSILMIAIIAGGVMGMNRLIASKPETKSRPAFRTVYTVDLVTAQAADNRPSFLSYGQIVAARTVDLRALVSGEVESISPNLRVGARVEKGETLLVIDPFDYEGARSEAASNLAEAQSRIAENEARIALEEAKVANLEEQLEFARRDLERITQLRQRGQSTEQQREARQLVVTQRAQAVDLARNTIAVEQARLEQLRASLARLEWRVRQAERNLENTRLIAPFTGIVRSATAETGRLVNANDVVVALYEEGSLEARFTLTDERYGRLQTGDGLIGRGIDITWTVGGKSYTWPGTIERLGAEITSTRGGVEVFAKVRENDNPVALRPGAFVEVRVPDVVFASSFRLPGTALYGRDTMYVSVDGKLEERTVEIAAYDGDSVIVASGLSEGDRVLTTRITEVSAGLSVQTEEEAANAASERSRSASGGSSAQGRPGPDEIAKILAANNLTREQFQALSQEERRELVRAFRAKATN